MSATSEFFQVGGTLSEDAPSYIERSADQELLTALKEQALCLVLAPRQMGKSSLMVHALSRLREAGKRTGIIDLQLLGSHTDLEQWFGDVVFQIGRSFSLSLDIVSWWQDYRRPGPTQRFRTFIEDILLKELSGEIIIFFDEIDSVLSLPFSDEFFTSMRSIYNARATYADLRRITFVLLGVASPSSFIRDRSRTPFNIGKSITLTDFDQESTVPFRHVLGPESDNLINRIFYWTNGQPFLVQTLAAAAFSWSPAERSVSKIDEEVRTTYLERKIERDTHLGVIQNYLIAESNQTARVLRVYRRVLKGKPVIENERSPIQNRLKLSGVVRADNEKLVVRNRIYENIFNHQWISAHLPGISPKVLVLLSQLPLYFGLWLWWEQVKEQPLLVILFCALYEVCVLALSFGSAIWIKGEDDISQKLPGRISVVVNNYVSGFRSRYKNHVTNKHGTFNQMGLGLINTFALSLDQVFVDLRIIQGNPQKFNIDPIAKAKITDRRSIWDFLLADKQDSGPKVLAIIGPPGCGKTTLLQHVAITFAAGLHKRYDLKPQTPILLSLRDHIETITDDKPPSLGKLIQSYFANVDMFPTLAPPRGWFERELERGKCMVLLDGLDEVAEAQQRSIVSAWIDNQITNYSNCSFVLTARPQGYRDAPLKKADTLEVQPFTDKQVHEFVENWYLANEIKASGERDNPNVRITAHRAASELSERLRAAPSLAALTVNPLLLTMIAMVHRYYGALPGSRVGLYASICEVLLGRWRQSKGVLEELNAQEKLTILRPLASFMMEHKLREISVHDASSVVAEQLRLLGEGPESFQNFLESLQASSGLLLENEVGHWSFAHLTFQEFLTAAHWVQQKASNCNWSNLVGDSWWRETLRLYAAQSDASPIIEACLEGEHLSSLALAADCLEEAREMDPLLRQATESRVIVALESDDPVTRNFAAEVRLSRRLSSLQRIDDNREIDLDYLTCAEYQVFLNDGQRQSHRPDHWSNFYFSSGDALKPVAGVRVEDAMAFCTWLTQRRGDNVVFRLPQSDQAFQYPANSAGLGTWCSDGRGIFRLVGLEEDRQQTITRYLRQQSDLHLPRLDELYRVYDVGNARTIARELARSLESSLDLSTRMEDNPENGLRVAEELVYGIDRAINLMFQLSRNPNLFEDINASREGARNLGLALTVDIDSNHERLQALEVAGKLDRALGRGSSDTRILDIKSAFSRSRRGALNSQLGELYDISQLLEISFENAQGLASILKIISDVTRQHHSLLETLSRAEWDEVRQQLQDRETVSDSILAHLARWLSDEAVGANSRNESEITLTRTLYSYKANLKLPLLKLYWWSQIVKARRRNDLAAWEGIRIVRERLS